MPAAEQIGDQSLVRANQAKKKGVTWTQCRGHMIWSIRGMESWASKVTTSYVWQALGFCGNGGKWLFEAGKYDRQPKEMRIK